MERNILALLKCQKEQMNDYLLNLQMFFEKYDSVFRGANGDVLFVLNLGKLIKSNFNIENDEFDNIHQVPSIVFQKTRNKIVEDLDSYILNYKRNEKISVKLQNHYYVAKTSIDKINKYLTSFYDDCKRIRIENENLVKKFEDLKKTTKQAVVKGNSYLNTSKAVRNYFKTKKEVLVDVKEK